MTTGEPSAPDHGAAELVVFTDGACSGNPGPGGWAWALDGGSRSCSGSERQSTNQRMEIWAVLDALGTLLAEEHHARIVVVSDSTYVVNCFRDRWWAGWEQRGWRNSQKQPVANQDLWKPLIGLYKARRAQLTFRWVKGHSGHPMNDLVDRLAVAAAAAQTPRTDSAGSATAVGPEGSRREPPSTLFG